MTPLAKRCLRRASKITSRRCATDCPDYATAAGFRCCSANFCESVRLGLIAIGEEIPDRQSEGWPPFLGPDGCVVPPEFRPASTGFMCPELVSLYPGTVARRDRLMDTAAGDEDVGKMIEAGSIHSERILTDLFRESIE